MLTRAQDAFRKELPGFDAGKLLGASLESMTREPAVLRGVIERLTDIATRQEVIGGRTMKTIMSPMKDDTGRRLGTVIEWFDRTQEVATESELHGSHRGRHRRQSRQPHFARRQTRILPDAVRAASTIWSKRSRPWSSKCAAWWPRPTRAT